MRTLFNFLVHPILTLTGRRMPPKSQLALLLSLKNAKRNGLSHSDWLKRMSLVTSPGARQELEKVHLKLARGVSFNIAFGQSNLLDDHASVLLQTSDEPGNITVVIEFLMRAYFDNDSPEEIFEVRKNAY